MGIYTTGSSLGLVISLSATNSVFMPLADGDWRSVMFLYAFKLHPALFHDPPRACVFLIGYRDDPLKAAFVETVFKPCVSTLIANAHSPVFRNNAVTNLDLACVFKRLETAAADSLARFLPYHRALPKAEFLIAVEIKIHPLRYRLGILFLQATQIK